ncbi:MAG: hypothetical protein QNL24_00870 [Akkermansiaceae bacterium]
MQFRNVTNDEGNQKDPAEDDRPVAIPDEPRHGMNPFHLAANVHQWVFTARAGQDRLIRFHDSRNLTTLLQLVDYN